MKRILTVCLAVMLVLPTALSLAACRDGGGVSIVPSRSVIASGETEDGLRYAAYSDGTCAVTGYTGSADEVVVPAELGGHAVTDIGKHAFDFQRMSSVVLPEGLLRIGANAFEYSRLLKTVTIPQTLTEIGSWAFSGCTALDGVVLPEGLVALGEYAFSGCTSLTSMRLPAGIRTLPAGLCNHCEAMVSIEFASPITAIGEYALCGCLALRSFTVPDTVGVIGQWAFGECAGLREVSLPRSVTAVGYCAFFNCRSLETLTYAGSADEWAGVVVHSDAFLRAALTAPAFAE